MANISQRQSQGPPANRTIRRTVVNPKTGEGRTTITRTENRARNFSRDVAGPKGGSVGALEAEFIIAIAVLFLIFLSDTDDYTTKIMSFMKRGTLTCLLFFILAIISSSGEKTARVAKVFGALVIVALLLKSPTTTILGNIDNLIKNDWTGSDESGTNFSADQNAKGSSVVTLTESEISKITDAAIGSPAYNAFTADLRAWKSGQVWKVPADAFVSVEDTGVHGIKKAAGYLDDIAHFFGL
jgi:hypothetical protein